MRVERVLANRKEPSTGCMLFSTDHYYAYSVQRVETQRDANGAYLPIPDDRQLEPDHYFLSFLNKENQQIADF